MADYIEKLRDDIVDQFRDKEKIDALLEVLGEQLNDVYNFFIQLRDERDIQRSVGKQLDGIGDIVVLSRKEGGEMACETGSVYVLTDDEYRRYLFYKIWKNSCECTYSDIMRAIRMFWDKPIYYSEDPSEPATITLQTDDFGPDDDISVIMHTPFVKAGGVKINIIARTLTPKIGFEICRTACMPIDISTTALTEREISVVPLIVEFGKAAAQALEISVTSIAERAPRQSTALDMALSVYGGSGIEISSTNLPEMVPTQSAALAAALSVYGSSGINVSSTSLPERK